jgi:hypothetical protein
LFEIDVRTTRDALSRAGQWNFSALDKSCFVVIAHVDFRLSAAVAFDHDQRWR